MKTYSNKYYKATWYFKEYNLSYLGFEVAFKIRNTNESSDLLQFQNDIQSSCSVDNLTEIHCHRKDKITLILGNNYLV